jgi:hypothetical protein
MMSELAPQAEEPVQKISSEPAPEPEAVSTTKTTTVKLDDLGPIVINTK